MDGNYGDDDDSLVFPGANILSWEPPWATIVLHLVVGTMIFTMIFTMMMMMMMMTLAMVNVH